MGILDTVYQGLTASFVSPGSNATGEIVDEGLDARVTKLIAPAPSAIAYTQKQAIRASPLMDDDTDPVDVYADAGSTVADGAKITLDVARDVTNVGTDLAQLAKWLIIALVFIAGLFGLSRFLNSADAITGE